MAFVVEIETGNEAMSQPLDLAVALRGVADAVESGWEEGQIRDANGNAIGRYTAHDYN
jgi:hypothetical protein